MAADDHLLAAIARDQRGVFTMAQATASGLTERAVRARVDRGIFERIHPGVFGFAGSGSDWHRRVLAAVLSASEPAAASHRTAAYLWGMTSLRPKTIEVVSRRHLRVRRSLFTVHESKDLVESDIIEIDGIPATTAVRTIVDLGASASPRFVERCLDTGLRKKLFTAWQVRCFIARVGRSGRIGVGTIRPLVLERLTWATITDSDLEDLFRIIVKRSPFPMPETQYRLYKPTGEFVGRFDFAYPTRMALIETDSEGWHMDPVSFRRDREKQNAAHALGWTVYRFTWRQLVDDPQSVLDIIAAIWTD